MNILKAEKRDTLTYTDIANRKSNRETVDKQEKGLFCQKEGCVHYLYATKYPRKCYYSPQCWRGFLDALLLPAVNGLKRRYLHL